MGDPALGVITSHFYSTAHDSAENREYVAAFRQIAPNMRPNFMSVGGFDGMRLIAEGLRGTSGNTDGQRLLDAMRGKSWVSPRGPITIDANTRDIVQDVYIRRVERRDGQLWNIEFDRIPQVRDPGT
jgi:branched-chain amino acid transport system substrate-binding protein